MKKHYNIKENNGMWGKHHSSETRRKIAKLHWKGGWKNNLPHCIDCGKKLHSYYAKRCRKHAAAGKNNSNYKHGKHCTNHYCIDCGALIDKHGRALRCPKHAHIGKMGSMYGKLPSPKTSHGKRIKYKNITFRSSYEYLYARYLTKNRIKWLYESKTFDLGESTYTPDFYLPESNEYIEIKGYWIPKAIKKFILFRKKYNGIKIQVLNKIKLQSLRILGGY
jgi:hypothetical protein